LSNNVYADALSSDKGGNAKMPMTHSEWFSGFGQHYRYMFKDWLALIEQDGQRIGALIENICGKRHGLRILDPTSRVTQTIAEGFDLTLRIRPGGRRFVFTADGGM
jgi:hypothetical protein